MMIMMMKTLKKTRIMKIQMKNMNLKKKKMKKIMKKLAMKLTMKNFKD